MEPLIALVLVTLSVRATGGAGVVALQSWTTALRGGLAAMFTLTGGAHFVGMRSELIAMVPDGLPAPDLLVTVSGVLELLGALGLLVSRRTARWSAWSLTALLLALFPANVQWALSGHASTWIDKLAPRTVLQVVFLAATITVARGLGRSTHLHPPLETSDDSSVDAVRLG